MPRAAKTREELCAQLAQLQAQLAEWKEGGPDESKAQRESDELLRYVIQHDPNAIAVYDTNLRYVFVSDRYLSDYRIEDRDIIGKHHYEVFPEMPQRWKDVHQRVLAGAVEHAEEDGFERPDGTIDYNRWECRPWYRHDGSIGGMITYTEVITERKRAELALRRSEEQFRRAFDHSAMLMAMVGFDGRLLRVNDALVRTLGYSRDELLRMTADQLVHPDEVPETLKRLERLRHGERDHYTVQSRYLHKDGQTIHALLTIACLHDEHGQPDTIVTQALDITARIAAEDELRRSRAVLAEAGRMAQVGGWELDLANGTIHLSDEHVRIHGLSRNTMPFEELKPVAHPDDLPAIERAVATAIVGRGPYDLRHRIIRQTDGAVRIIQAHAEVVETNADGRPLRLCGVAQDITDQVALEEQLRQSQRLDAIGQLAGGVAHDFNNILTAIIGNAELMRVMLTEKVAADDPVLEGLDQIDHSAHRAAALTRQLLAFGRKQLVRPEIIDPRKLLSDMEKMLRRLIREDITLHVETEENVRPVRADVSQVEQVIVNLVVNARDAVRAGGAIHLLARNVDLDAGHRAAHPEATHGPHVAFVVRDTGVGMDAATRARVFEPFFTTKEVGQGTGLGLATAHGIVRQAGGHIDVESTVGTGSTFTVYWPAAAHEVASGPAEPARGITVSGTETILVCEDDQAVRELAVRALREHGYTVLAADQPHDALHIARQHEGPIDLLLTDVIMPQINGHELATRLIETRRKLKVLYVSGYTANVIGSRGILDEGVHFLEKPYGSRELLTRLRTILDDE